MVHFAAIIPKFAAYFNKFAAYLVSFAAKCRQVGGKCSQLGGKTDQVGGKLHRSIGWSRIKHNYPKRLCITGKEQEQQQKRGMGNVANVLVLPVPRGACKTSCMGGAASSLPAIRRRTGNEDVAPPGFCKRLPNLGED